jgi:predicted amidohydrolase
VRVAETAFESSAMFFQDLAKRHSRAIEKNVYLALANRAGSEIRENEHLTFKGKSAIYDINGRTLKAAGAADDEVLTAEI